MSDADVDRKLEYRRDFPNLVFDSFSRSKPVFIVNGNVEEKIQVGNKSRHLVDILVQKAVESDTYDLVIIYNAANKDMRFGDEYLHYPKKDLYMKDEFSGLHISLSADVPGGGDQIAKLFDPKHVKDHAGAASDSTFFTVLGILAEEHLEKRFLVIIDHGDDILPDESDTSRGASHAAFPSRLTDIVRNLKGTTGRNVIVLDNKRRISGSLTRELPQLTVPQSTEAEVRDILSPVIRDPDKLIQAVQFAVTIDVNVLMDMVGKPHTDVDTLLRKLIALRTETIKKMSNGNLEATIGWKDDEVALSSGAKAYCDGIVRNFFTRKGLVGSGVLLVGPPGTGKSVIPQYIASQAGVPFLRMGSMNTEGLSGVATQKLEAVFAAIEANKPCIVFIDEIDKLLPSGKSTFRSDNDDQFRALFLLKMADEHTMRGVLFFGASNNPENLSDAMTRSGRFEKTIAVLPPQTVEERILVFKAVWNQRKSNGDFSQGDPAKYAMVSDNILTALLHDFPSYITGSDLKQMIGDAIKKMDKKKSPYATILEAILDLKRALLSGKYIKRGVISMKRYGDRLRNKM